MKKHDNTEELPAMQNRSDGMYSNLNEPDYQEPPPWVICKCQHNLS